MFKLRVSGHRISRWKPDEQTFLAIGLFLATGFLGELGFHEIE